MKKLILFSILTLLAARSYADDYYWVGGAGDWSDVNHWASTPGGAADKLIVPRSVDDVYFDANSGLGAGATVNMPTDVNAFCRNMSWVGVTTAAIFRNTGSFQLIIHGNLELSATVLYDVRRIAFSGSGSTTLRMNGAVMNGASALNNFIINKPAGSLQILDGIPAGLGVENIVLTEGHLNMSNNTHSFGGFDGDGTTITRSADISNATLMIKNTWTFRGANGSLTATGSYINAQFFHSDRYTFPKVDITGTAAGLVINNTTFGELTFTNATAPTGSVRIAGNNTIDRLEFKGGGRIAGGGSVINKLILAPSKGYIFHGTNTINELMQLNTPDCEALGELTGANLTAVLSFGAAATTDIRNVYIKSLTAAGSIAPITVIGADGGDNNGWDFQPRSSGITLYWVGGSGDWNDKAHWSATSGGAGGACVPFTGDDVVFNAGSGFASGNNTVSVTGNAWCHSMTWTNVAASPVLSQTAGTSLEVWGSIALHPTLTINANLMLRGTELSTFTTNGCTNGTLTMQVNKSDISGGLVLADDVNLPSLDLTHQRGQLTLPNRTLNIERFASGSGLGRVIDISGATITVNYWNFGPTNVTWVNNAAGSFITSKRGFTTNGLTYPKVHCNMLLDGASIQNATIGELTFTNTAPVNGLIGLLGGNTVETLEFKSGGELRGNNTINNLLLAPSKAYTIRNTQTVNGLFRFNSPNCNGLGELRGITGASPVINFGPSSTLDLNNVYLQNMTATGTGVPVAVTGADAGGNTGFNITSASSDARYWVGGSGDWNDASHWSLTPGGPGGACVPTVTNDVFFDASSFTSGSSTVTISQGNAYCRNMDWTGATFAPVFSKPNILLTMEIWGNLIMNPAVTMNARILFSGATNSQLTVNSSALGNLDIDIIKPAGNSLRFMDNYNNAQTSIALKSGGLDLSDRTIIVADFTNAGVTDPTNLNITNATITANWEYLGSGKSLQAAGSTVTSRGVFKVDGGTYNKIDVTATTDNQIYIATTTVADLVFSDPSPSSGARIINGNTIGRLEFKGKGLISGTGNTIDILIFSPGKVYNFADGSNTTITSAWYGSGTPCNLTEISAVSTTATVTKTTGEAEFDYIRVRGITAAGVTPFKALEHSEDLGNNTNWQIAPYNGSTPILGLGPDLTLCATEFPHTLNTDGFFASPLASFAWNTGSTAQTITVTDPGTYSVTVSYPDGCSRTDEIVITRSDVTVEPITGSTSVCKGAATPLASLTANGTWSTSDATIATVSATGEVTGVAPGTATITYTVTNANGCSASQQLVMTVNDVPTVAATTGTLTLFAGGTTTLSNTTPGGAWSSNDVAVATVDAGGIVTGVAGGTADITYTVTGTGGCTASSTVTVTVDGFSPEKRVVSITKTADAQEPLTNGGFSISLPAGVNAVEDITVTYTVGGTASPTDDYTPLTGTATIAAGQNSVPLQIIVANDGFIENTETVEVTLTAATGTTGTTYTYTLSGTSKTASADIQDDDNTTASRVLSVNTVSNGVEGGTAGRFYIGLPTNIKASENVTVTYTMGGTAINGTDYTNMTGTVIIPAGSNGVDVFITVTDDKIIEGNEEVTLTVSGGTTPSTGNFTASTTQGDASLVIVDNDNTAASRTVSVTTAGNAAEPGTHSSFTISLPAGMTAAEDVTVNYTISGTATNGADYTAIAISAIIPTGENSVVIPVTVTNDGLIELNETVTLTIGSSTSTNFTFPASTTAGSATLTITDDDNTAANRTLTVSKVTDAAEPGTSGGFRVSLPTGIKASQNIGVTYSVGAGTATPGTDYRAITGTITIPAGASEVFVPVTVIDNIVIEPSETVILNISGGTSTNFTYTAAAGGGSATVNIADNDYTPGSKVVLISKIADAIEGGSNGQYRVSLPPGVISSEDVVITFAYLHAGAITATPGTDFNLLGISSGRIVIPAGANEVFIDVDAGNDGLIEGPEKVIISLTGASSASFPYTIDPTSSTAAVDIIDANAASSTPLQVITGTNAAEPLTNATFTVKLAGVATSAWPVTVGYRLSGTATTGQDYESIGTLVIPRNVNSITVNLRVKDDQIIEPTETMTITLLSGSATDGGGNAFIFPADPANDHITVNIADNDAPVAANRTLSVVKSTDAAEPSSTGTYTISLPAGYTSSANTTLSYTMTGTAIRNTDYTIFTITLPAGQNSVSLPVNVTNDQIIEGTETMILNLSGGTDGNSFTYSAAPGAATATMNLADDDNVPDKMVLSITNTGNAAEPATNGSYRVSLPAGVTCAFPITVDYTTAGNATASDFAALPPVFTIPAGAGGVTVPVEVSDDALIEKTETVNVTLLGGSTTAGLNFTPFAGNNSATVTISDNDNIPANTTIGVTAGANITEGAGTTTGFTISLDGGVLATEDVTVTYTASGSAIGGRDYTVLGGTAVIPAGQSSVTVNLTDIDDEYIEDQETVILTLFSASSNSFSWTISPTAGAATLNIADDDNTPGNMVLTATKVADGAEPGTNGMFRISLPDGVLVPENIIVTYVVTGTATPDADYTDLSRLVEIPAGQSGVNVPVMVLNDQVIEPAETVEVMVIAGITSSLTFTGSGMARVNIADDEVSIPANMTLTVSKTADAGEPLTNGGFSIGLPSGITLSEDLTVTYTVAGTATAGDDYTALSGTAVIPAGQPAVSIPVTVEDDQFIELDETVEITLTGGRSANFTFAGTGSATVTIADDERTTPASMELTVSKDTDGAEPGTNGSFTISLPTGVTSTEDVTVGYTISGTATADADYTAITGAIVIPAGQPGVTVPVTISNDQVIEPAETVVMTLAGGTSTSFTLTGTGNATVNIADDDNTAANRVLTITKVNDAAEPGTTGRATVSLPANITTAEDITVNYTIGGSATEDEDYAPLTGTVIIPAGKGSIQIPVAVIDDQVIEAQENVTLTLTGGSSNGNAFTGSGNVIINITDNDNTPANLVLNVTSNAAAGEPDTHSSFTISLPEDITAAENITVNYGVGGTATANDDYSFLTGTVVIPAGSNSVDVTVTVMDDLLIEGTETVTLEVTGGTSTNFTLTPGANKTASLDIIDDEADPARLVVSVANDRDGTETGTNGNFTISLPAGVVPISPVTVTYTITGTATSGTDYTALSGTAVIAAGSNSVAVPVTVINDDLVEGPETVTIKLTRASATGIIYTIGVASEATVTITSEDIPVGDLIITKEMVQPLTGPYRLGQDITYRITVRNIGDGIASGVVVTDTLPIQLALPSNTRASGGQVTVNADNKIVIWTIGEMLPNASLQLEVHCRIVEGGELEATAEAGSTTRDADPANNKATMRFPILGQDMSFPNVFSPNGDGKNERFIIGGVEKYPGAKLQVFNRWGSQVYRSNDYRNDWNGSDLNEGTYFYILEVNKPDGIKTYKGWVLIVR